jgi:Antitoxin MazE-like
MPPGCHASPRLRRSKFDRLMSSVLCGFIVTHLQRCCVDGIPDVRSPQFAQQAHDQSLAVATSDVESDDQAFIDALGDE